MGYIKHHTLVITGWYDGAIEQAHTKAKEIFESNFSDEPYAKPYGSSLVSEIIKGLVNGQATFFIAPDGSKEGWETSDNGNRARKELMDWLDKQDSCEYVEVVFGGDSDYNAVERSNNSETE